MAVRSTTTARPTKRTTAGKARRPVVDIGADIDDEIDDADVGPAPTKVINLWGTDITLKCRVNEYLLNAALGNDLEAVNRFFESLMEPVEYRKFKDVMATHENMTQERFAKVFGKILEAVSERPTN